MDHVSVLLEESIALLQIDSDKNYIDATVGAGGHSQAILQTLKKGSGHLFGLDLDLNALDLAQQRLSIISDNFTLIQSNFSDIDKIVTQHNIVDIGGIIADLGVSSMELDQAERGFSFNKEAPLDMRFDQKQEFSAYNVVNSYSEERLALLFRTLGDEPFPGRIARVIKEYTKKQKIETTTQLAQIIQEAVPRKFASSRNRIHPATRVFQAIRMEVNAELDVLKDFIQKSIAIIPDKSVLVIISFHSGEDRIVKHLFQGFKKQGLGTILTKKPITPNQKEILLNRRSRSSKLRGFQIIKG